MTRTVSILVAVASLLSGSVSASTPAAGVKTHADFGELPLSSIKPKGWLKLYLEKMRDGLGGHMAEAAGYPFDTCMWNGEVIPPNAKQTESAWPAYEQTGYYIDGMLRTGYLLGDQALVDSMRVNIEYQLTHQKPNGELGPVHIEGRWCRTPFFRALVADHSVTTDPRIVEVLKKHYFAGLSDFGGNRDVTHVEIMCWLYELTGDDRLLDLAQKAYTIFNQRSFYATKMQDMLSDAAPYLHGVSYSETVKIPAILYMYTGEKRFLDAAANGIRKLMLHHGLISGVHSSQERTMGRYSLCRHETCNISDLSWSLGYMLMASGEAVYGDMIEKSIFNAGMGAITKDFKAFQYFSSPNQADATSASWHGAAGLMGSHMMYRPDQGPACCNGNLVRFLPNYVSRMWLRDVRTGGLIAALYGPCSVSAAVGEAKVPVTIVQTTGYPFAETVEFEIQADRPVRFPLSLRIPAWTTNPTLLLNGTAWQGDLKAGSFATIEREFSPGDRIALTLPMSVQTSRWPLGGIGLERGPLIFSLPLQADTKIESYADAAKQFPRYSMVATSEWNYAIYVDDKKGTAGFKVATAPLPDDPWAAKQSPIRLEVPVYKLEPWQFDYKARKNKDGTVNYHPHTPELPNPWSINEMTHYMKKQNQATLAFEPLGRTLLRMTIFPVCGKQPGDQVEDLVDGITHEKP